MVSNKEKYVTPDFESYFLQVDSSLMAESSMELIDIPDISRDDYGNPINILW